MPTKKTIVKAPNKSNKDKGYAGTFDFDNYHDEQKQIDALERERSDDLWHNNSRKRTYERTLRGRRSMGSPPPQQKSFIENLKFEIWWFFNRTLNDILPSSPSSAAKTRTSVSRRRRRARRRSRASQEHLNKPTSTGHHQKNEYQKKVDEEFHQTIVNLSTFSSKPTPVKQRSAWTSSVKPSTAVNLGWEEIKVLPNSDSPTHTREYESKEESMYEEILAKPAKRRMEAERAEQAPWLEGRGHWPDKAKRQYKKYYDRRLDDASTPDETRITANGMRKLNQLYLVKSKKEEKD